LEALDACAGALNHRPCGISRRLRPHLAPRTGAGSAWAAYSNSSATASTIRGVRTGNASAKGGWRRKTGPSMPRPRSTTDTASAIQTEPVAGEYECAHHRLQDVVTQRHLADGGQTAGEPTERAGLCTGSSASPCWQRQPAAARGRRPRGEREGDAVEVALPGEPG
jgi:hypothetical protein